MITHKSWGYRWLRFKINRGRHNGCYYYSKEIVKNIIPRIKTDRDWNTVGRDFKGMHDGMIVFLHDNSTPWNYYWLKKYKDLVLVCSSKYTADSVKYSGRIILLPMSVDTEYVKKFKTKKTKDTCLVGNVWARDNIVIPDKAKIDYLGSMPRRKLLKKMAKYKKVYAIDRCAIEAKVLGCKLLPLESRYSCDNVGKVLDNKQAAKILQRELNKIDKGGKNVQKGKSSPNKTSK